MRLQPIEKIGNISDQEFKNRFYKPGVPVVLTALARQWPAFEKWSWEYFQQIVGDKKVGIYNNIKSDAYTPVNKADDYINFGDYIEMVRKGPSEWRIFLFNIFNHAPQLSNDFTWPENLMKGFVKRAPMLFVGGSTSITHMHFDMDMSHILHTQFFGRKKVLMFPYREQHKLYRKPFEVLSLADFSNYDKGNGKPDYDRFPALKLAQGYEITLEHGDTLFMPSGYWHHMEYIDSGFAMSLRAVQRTVPGIAKGIWNLMGMRHIDTMMKKTAPAWWYDYKKGKIFRAADKELQFIQ